MSQFIIELGSGNTCRNDVGLVREMIDAVAVVDTGKHEVVLKWQLFENQPPNEPLLWRTFAYAYGYACERGYETAASVFDVSSLRFLEQFDVPFVKIANRPDLYWLEDETELNIYMSYRTKRPDERAWKTPMACVSHYPATVEDYLLFEDWELQSAISDHTVGWRLYHKYKPDIIEKHFVLEHSDDNPDAGPFAVTPTELSEVL